jgi:hypothetical protein
VRGDAIATLSGGGIMSHWKIGLPAVILLGGFLVCSTASYGTQEYAKTTKKACTYCHQKMVADKDAMNKNLTDAGKYYHEKKTLDGYVEKK